MKCGFVLRAWDPARCGNITPLVLTNEVFLSCTGPTPASWLTVPTKFCRIHIASIPLVFRASPCSDPSPSPCSEGQGFGIWHQYCTGSMFCGGIDVCWRCSALAEVRALRGLFSIKYTAYRCSSCSAAQICKTRIYLAQCQLSQLM